MGSASSKFKKYLQHGDEFAAMQIFQSSPELRKNLDPNLSYGDHHGHNTALHYAARHGMKHLLRTFLADLGGNPNKRNGRNESSLHCACQLNQTKSFSAQERRAACVTLLLQWKGVVLSTGNRERVDLSAQDQDGNTALHWAACTGLKRCVELLLAHGAPLFVENNDKMTPCDLAMRSSHHDIAQMLESRMVFADSSDTVNEDEGCLGEQEEVYSGLRTQDLQEAKDQLLVETSDMLHIPLFTAEALLRDNEWSREALLEKWMKDPVECCQLAGVQAPASAFQYNGSIDVSCSSPEVPPEDPANARSDILCEICLCPMITWDQPPVMMSCKHQFCSGCWERYLTVKIQDGDAHHILCPAYQCHILVPVEVIERLVSPEMARRYLQFDIKAFVESNKSIKWCPVAGCGRAVRLPETEQSQPIEHGKHLIPITSHAVDCGNAHFFCWECLGEAHAPSGCAQWQEWQKKITEVKPEELKASCNESEDAANCLWLVTNSKPCPNCKSPIQKNEGCNHMKCSKCKFDFCWVCQESWKRHSSATGGYFRCNRFEAAHRADEKQDSLITDAQVRNTHVQELSRFLHYYTRFRNHENSQRLEEPLLTGIRQKMEILASALPHKKQEESAEKGTKFVEDGVRELLKARRVLCGSYVYGYYLEDNGYNKTIFEFMQNELEEVTEKLSEMIARTYLRTPKAVIVQTTALTRRKRHEFVRAVAKGLVPPETPPALRKLEVTDALAASLKHLDGNSPWMKDAHSSHKLATLYDWPEYDSDEDTEVNRALAVSLVGECKAPKCTRPKARNPKTGAIHQYCSLRCSRFQDPDCDNLCYESMLIAFIIQLAIKITLPQDFLVYRMPLSSDYNMELVIALEMSRLQMIEDKMKQAQANNGTSEDDSNPGTSVEVENGSSAVDDSNYGLDDQLKLAIQLSLQESTAALNRQLQQQKSTDCKITSAKSTSSELRQFDTQYQRTSADITVDYFLKSLANQKIDLKNIGVGVSVYNTDRESDKECFFKPCNGNEDGRFQISDIHENGYAFGDVDDYDEKDIRLKRSHSTGDLCVRRNGRGFRVRTTGDEPRYHLDSDHSSQHDEKPEDISRRILALPSGSARTKQFLLLQNSSICTEESPTYQGHSSVEDTTTSDSLNADMEVCGILEALATTDPPACTSYENDEYRRKLEKSFEGKYEKNEEICSSSKKTEGISKIEELKKHNPFATLKAKLCSAHLPKTSYLTKIAVNKSIGLLSDPKNKKDYNDSEDTKSKSHTSDSRRNSDHGIQFKKKLMSGTSIKQSPKSLKHTKNPKRDYSFSKSTSFLLDTHKKESKLICGKSVTTNLRIKICKSPIKSAKPHHLETDSSNEYESETGIPKSPTLFISGVSISRTPEPKSPGVALISVGRQSRSSSLSVPVPISSCSLSLSNTSLNTTAATEPFTPSLVRSTTPASSRSGLHQSPGASPHKEQSTKAKSASEPEREREMFRFPKSSTDGALSSVLHVQESNLSSDDFHEALFLLERSPKTRDSKRRKKSKKKDKDSDRMKDEASSAL